MSVLKVSVTKPKKLLQVLRVNTPHSFLDHPSLPIRGKHRNIGVVRLDSGGLEVLHAHGHLDLPTNEICGSIGANSHGLRHDSNERLSSGASDLVCRDGGVLLINYYLLLLLGKGFHFRPVRELERIQLHLDGRFSSECLWQERRTYVAIHIKHLIKLHLLRLGKNRRAAQKENKKRDSTGRHLDSGPPGL
jgi:hypothetical protein